MDKSEAIDALAVALAKAQAKMRPAVKDSKNPHFGNKYADLASVWDACRDPLTANDLAVVQLPSTDGNIVSVTTTLMHKSGQWISSRASAQMAKTDPQSIGSAITYLRRYGLSAMVGIAPDDDDAEAASPRGQQVQRQVADTPPPSPPQVDWLALIAKGETVADLDALAAKMSAQIPKGPQREQLRKVFSARYDEVKKAAPKDKACSECGRSGTHAPSCPEGDGL